MKKISTQPLKIASFLLFLLLSIPAFSQVNIEVNEEDKSFSRGNFKAFTVDIPQATWKMVMSDWRSFLKQQSKKSTTEKNGEVMLPVSFIGRLGTDSLSVYATVATKETSTTLIAFYFIKDSIPVNTLTATEKTASIKSFMREFAVNEYKQAVEKELNEAEKQLRNLENAVDKIENENESLRKDINQNERANDRKRNDISTNEQEQKLKSDAIIQQKALLMNFKGTLEERDKEEKKLSSLEKEKKKLEKANESMHEKIDDNDSENRSLQKRIDKNNEDNIPAAKAAVNSQKNVVMQIREKLNNIK